MDWVARAAVQPDYTTLCRPKVQPLPPARCSQARVSGACHQNPRHHAPSTANPYDGDPEFDRYVGTHVRPTHQPEVSELLGRDRLEAEAELEARAYVFQNAWVPPTRPGLLDRPFTEHPGMIESTEPITHWGVGQPVTHVDPYNEEPAGCRVWHGLRATRTGVPRQAYRPREAFHASTPEPVMNAPVLTPTVPQRGHRGMPGRDGTPITYYDMDFQ